jgi:uncharacterized RDD family membrane protein YckC
MNWYYVDQGRQTGPISDEQLEEMVRSEKIQPDTLLWREGMAEWSPYREVKSGATASSTAGVAAATGAEAVCAECGKIFPADETIAYGNARVCAGCKPLFLQKLKEGAAINTGELRYAPVLTRFAAVFLDGLILSVINVALNLGIAATARSNSNELAVLQLVVLGIEIAIGMCYESLMIGKYGATLGKMACKIKVVTADGRRVSYARSFGRYFSKMLSGFACLIGYIIAFFDNPQKRALHDHICNTRVIYQQ